MFTAFNPAPGVKVYSVPRAAPQVSAAVRVAARTPLTNSKGEVVGVFKPHASGGPMTLGCISVSRELGNVYAGSKLRGKRSRCKQARGPSNMCFQNPIPTWNHYRAQLAVRKLAALKKTHWAILSYKGRNPSRRVEDGYELMRESFVRLHPEHVRDLLAMESKHFDSVRC